MSNKIHLSGYQARDKNVIDYHMYKLGSTGLSFRGPCAENLEKGQYFSCIGAAQTFGCFCELPYPALLSKQLGMPALNLGYGGAGPEFFNKQEKLHSYLNNSKFVIIQAMSGRSQSNSIFSTDGLELLTLRKTGEQLGSSEAYEKLLAGHTGLAKLPPKKLFRKLAKLLNQHRVKRVVEETRNNWLYNQLELIDKIKVPIVFLWFSKRAPDYRESYNSARALFGEFPQLINLEMISQIKRKRVNYVEVITDRGSPQPLFDIDTGQPTTVNPKNDRKDLDTGNKWTHNVYYPSPEMQEDAFKALLPICLQLQKGYNDEFPSN